MNVLVVYRLQTHPLRTAIRDHLYSFRRYSGNRYVYLNLAVRKVPRALAIADFDAVVFHTSFLSARWSPEVFEQMGRRAQPLKGKGRVRVALPQDEFVRTRQLGEFIDEFAIDHVCSVAPESEWPKIYAGVDRDRVRFRRVLTGYLDRRTVDRIAGLDQPLESRSIDIGYRARRHKPWVGRHGVLKAEIADAVGEAARGHGLSVDLSTRNEQVLLGDDWLRFLASCRYTIGAEGGASILDEDGSLSERTERYLSEHPDASFDEVEAACFPGRDGELALYALGPRHLEACATRTCQILVEGGYNGILRAGEHYLELSRDLSNLDDVLDTVGSDEARGRIVEAAYRDVVASGSVGYDRFVAEVEQTYDAAAAAAPGSSLRWTLLGSAATATDAASWAYIALRARYRRGWSRAYSATSRRLPEPAFRVLQRLRATGARLVGGRKGR